MMYIITYSLNENQSNSQQYYQDIAIYTDEVLLEARRALQSIILSYHTYLSHSDTAYQDSAGEAYEEESILELVIIGVLWRVYSGDAQELDEIPQHLLTILSQNRNQLPVLKPGIDVVRGILSTLFLSPDLYDNLAVIKPTMEHYEKLLLWIEATGEFTQEAKRLRRWQSYFLKGSEKAAAEVISAAISFALWFEKSSEERIGLYTKNVERYLNEIRPKRYWQEDVIFCGRRRVEYHLNMMGAEIMNRIFRLPFQNTSQKLLILPACMRLLSDSKCQARESEKGTCCMKCNSECQVNVLTTMGEKNNFSVMLVRHESSISVSHTQGALHSEDMGVIGVACTLNLISGGWMLEEKGIPAQCVLLDYCGCNHHWHHEGIPTQINIQKLREILEID